jgi:hypothetical protein
VRRQPRSCRALCDGHRADDEFFEAALEHGTLEEDAAAAAEAAQTDVGAEARDLPVVAAAGVGFAQADDVAEV